MRESSAARVDAGDGGSRTMGKESCWEAEAAVAAGGAEASAEKGAGRLVVGGGGAGGL